MILLVVLEDVFILVLETCEVRGQGESLPLSDEPRVVELLQPHARLGAPVDLYNSLQDKSNKKVYIG